MIQLIVNGVLIILCAFGAITHLLRLIWILFEPKFLSRYSFLKTPGKGMLIMYYVLVIGAAGFAIRYLLTKV